MQFTFASYVALTSINKELFFSGITQSNSNAESDTDPGVDLPMDQIKELTSSSTKDGELKTFEYEITSSYKHFTYIFLPLLADTDQDMLSVFGGQKGFTPNEIDSDPSNNKIYTTLQWTKDASTGSTSDEFVNNENSALTNIISSLHNKNELTEEGITITLLGTLKDETTEEQVQFKVKLTFKLGNLENPTITTPSTDPNTPDTTIDTPANAGEAEKVKLTIKGTNLPKDMELWNITNASQSNATVSNKSKIMLLEDGDTTTAPETPIDDIQNKWQIVKDESSTNNEQVTFEANYSDVLGMNLEFGIKGFDSVKQTFQMPTPKFSTDEGSKSSASLSTEGIKITLKGENLSGVLDSYEFVEIKNSCSDQSQQEGNSTPLNPTELGMTIKKEESNIVITIPKPSLSNSSSKSSTLEVISSLYGNKIKVSVKNHSDISTEIEIPTYESSSLISSLDKKILGTVQESSSKDNESSWTNLDISSSTIISSTSESAQEKNSNTLKNSFEVSITTTSSSNTYIQFDIKDYNYSSTSEVTSEAKEGDAQLEDFLSWFTFDNNPFTDSSNTSLHWEIQKDNLQTQESLIDLALDETTPSTTSNDWKLENGKLTNNSPLIKNTPQTVTLKGTLTDLQTKQTVTFTLKITVTLGASDTPSSPDTGDDNGDGNESGGSDNSGNTDQGNGENTDENQE